MADQPPLIFEKVLGSLRPVNEAARDAMKAMDGRVVVKVTKLTRNQRRRGFYWTLLGVVAELLTDQTGTPWDANTLHDDLRERLGLGEYLKTPTGRKVFKPLSTSDRSMNEIDRARWTDRVVNYLSQATNIEARALMDEVRQRGGDMDEAPRRAA